MVNVIVFIILICANGILSKDKSPIVAQVTEGLLAKLHCGNVIGDDPFVCNWFHNGSKIKAVEMKYEFEEKITNAECDLTILNLNSKLDHGLWECEIKVDNFVMLTKQWTLKFSAGAIKNHQILVFKGANTDIVEGQKLVLICFVDDMINTKLSWNSTTKANGNIIEFKNVSRHDSGYYTCTATNNFGHNSTVSTFIDVKYPPEFKMVEMSPKSYTLLQSSTHFNCVAEGNPKPKYSWVKFKSHSGNWSIVANTSQFSLMNTNYSSEGHYACHIFNTINDVSKLKVSEVVHLIIKGAPIINLNESSDATNSVTVGKSVKLTVSFCSSPSPTTCSWITTHNLVLKSNNSNSRFSAFPLETVDGTNNCYSANFFINSVSRRDSGLIMFKVKNIYGTMYYTTKLTVLGKVQEMDRWAPNKFTINKTLHRWEIYPFIARNNPQRTWYFFIAIGIKSDAIKIITYTIMALAAVVVGLLLYTLYQKKFFYQQQESPLVDDNSARRTVEDYPRMKI